MDEKALDQIRQIIRVELVRSISRWLTQTEAEAYAAGSRTNLKTLTKKGLPVSRVGSKPIYDRREIDKVLDSLKAHEEVKS